MMFPTPGARIYRNEAGEPLGWEAADDDGPPYCDECGFTHFGFCDFDEADEGDE